MSWLQQVETEKKGALKMNLKDRINKLENQPLRRLHAKRAAEMSDEELQTILDARIPELSDATLETLSAPNSFTDAQLEVFARGGSSEQISRELERIAKQ